MSEVYIKPEFLTAKPQREKVLREVGNDLNKRLQRQKAEEGHLLEHMSNHMKSSDLRNKLSGFLGDYFSGDEGIEPRYDQNMLALEADKKWYYRVIKIDILDEEKPPKQTRTILREIKKALASEDSEEVENRQLPLFADEDDPIAEKRTIPLGNLRHGIVGYMVGISGLIIGFAFAEYDETCSRLVSAYIIDLDNNSNTTIGISTPTPDFDPSNSSTKIKINPSYTPTPPERDEDKA